MKKLLFVLTLALALNFVGVIGGIGWLVQSNHLDKQKIAAIEEILFPPLPATQPATQPTEEGATTQPTHRLTELLEKYAGHPPAEQLQLIQNAFDEQKAELGHLSKEIQDRERFAQTVEEKLKRDQQALDEREKKLTAREEQLDKAGEDKGFQDTLAMYQAMPAKQAKTLLMGLDDAVVTQYLQAMEPRAASKITKEFKTPEESDRLKRILERMRQPPITQPQASVKE